MFSIHHHAINAKDVKFQYGKKEVLTNINLKVPYSKIYSLLGPSGAGKTTLLRLILGRIHVNAGELKVLHSKPGLLNRYIGYMPQDQALCLSFTVGQTLKYFAQIYRLTDKEFIQKKTQLRKLLDLPEDKCNISELSGGQQKVVSLSITLLQDAKLLILDEPTVGSDPMLGDCIWNYLHNLCQTDGTTIILVTHYIEEAARAHITGIMRNGKILEEGSPARLIRTYGKNTLEEVFLHLCLMHLDENDNIPIAGNSKPTQSPRIAELSLEPPLETPKTPEVIREARERLKQTFFENLLTNLYILFVLIEKNLLQTIRSKVSFIGFAIPAFQVLILSSIFAADSVPIPIGVYNAELPTPDYSVKIFENITKVEGYFIDPISYESLELALDALDHRKVAGVIEFAGNFTESLWGRYVEPDYMDEQTLNNSDIKLYLDNTDYIFGTAFVDTFRQTVFNFLNQLHTDQNLTKLDPPIEFKEIIYGKDVKLADYMLPGFMIAFVYLSQVAISSQSLMQEKREGLFERSLVAGVSHEMVLLSHFFSSFIISIFQVASMFVVAFGIYSLTNLSPIWSIFILVFFQALASVATGLLISTIVEVGASGLIMSFGIALPQIFCSGTIFPKEMIPKPMQKVVYFTPIGLPSESLRNAMLKGWSLIHPYVFNGLLVNILSILILLIISCILFKRY